MAVEIDPAVSASLEYAKEQKAWWAAQEDKFATQLKEAAGDEDELVIDGKVVWTFARTATLQLARFKKEQPEELVEAFLELQEEQVFNAAKLKRQRPDLYAEYQTRTLRRAS